MKRRYSSQVTSCACIQNGSIRTVCTGPSSFLPPAVPIANSPPGIGTMSYVTDVSGIVTLYGRMSAPKTSSRQRLSELGNTGPRHGSDGQAHVPIQLFGKDALFRIENVIPGDLLARVCGHASHQRQHR